MAEGNTHRSTAERFKVSVKFVNDMVKLKAATGDLAAKPQGNGGGHGKLAGLKDWVARRIGEKRDLTAAALAVEIATTHGVTVRRGSVWSLLRGHEFEEPAILQGRGDRLILVLRDKGTRRLHQCVSADGGRTWSAPEPLPVKGYPAHLLRLQDGRILMTYGWREPGFSIRAVFSEDDGASWDTARTVLIRDGMPNGNLGYPATVERGDGTLISLYYAEDVDGVTALQATCWRPN